MLNPRTAVFGQIKSILRNSLRILKDEEYQRRVWFLQEGSEVSTYSDSVVHFIGNCESIFGHSISEKYLGQENYQLMKQLYDRVIEHINLIEDRIDPDLLEEDELLNDPAWHDIQQLAQKLDEKLREFVKRESADG